MEKFPKRQITQTKLKVRDITGRPSSSYKFQSLLLRSHGNNKA